MKKVGMNTAPGMEEGLPLLLEDATFPEEIGRVYIRETEGSPVDDLRATSRMAGEKAAIYVPRLTAPRAPVIEK